ILNAEGLSSKPKTARLTQPARIPTPCPIRALRGQADGCKAPSKNNNTVGPILGTSKGWATMQATRPTRTTVSRQPSRLYTPRPGSPNHVNNLYFSPVEGGIKQAVGCWVGDSGHGSSP